MRYYLIPIAIAQELGLAHCRKQGIEGVLVNSNDLTGYGEDRAVENGARMLSHHEALVYSKQYHIKK